MDLSCPSLLMDKLTLDGTSDYGSRETSSEETIGGICQVEFRGMHHVISRVSFTLVTFLERIIVFQGPRLFLQVDGVEHKKNWKCLLFNTRFLQMSSIPLKPLNGLLLPSLQMVLLSVSTHYSLHG